MKINPMPCKPGFKQLALWRQDTESACEEVPRLYRQRPDNNKIRVKKTSQAQADASICLRALHLQVEAGFSY